MNNSHGTPIGRPNASAAELAALRTALTGLEQAVHATPMLTAPRGFNVHASQQLDRGCPQNPVLCRQAPLPGWIDFEFGEYRVLDGKVMTWTGGPADIEVAFNNPEATYVGHHAGGDLIDLSGNMIVGPLIEVERVGNVAILDTGVVILGRNPRPFFVPASREQYLRALMAQSGTPLPTPWPGEHMISEGFRDELAALSPEQRQASPLFIFNPEYFDPALPRTAIQLITVRFLGSVDGSLHSVYSLVADRPDLLERSPLTPERLAFLTASGISVVSYRVFELTRLLNYSALTALLAAPTPPAR